MTRYRRSPFIVMLALVITARAVRAAERAKAHVKVAGIPRKAGWAALVLISGSYAWAALEEAVIGESGWTIDVQLALLFSGGIPYAVWLIWRNPVGRAVGAVRRRCHH